MRWACRAADAAPVERLFGDGDFPAGRAMLVPTPYRPPAQAASAAFPLLLMTGRVRDQWHTMTRTGKTPRLLAHVPEPFLALNLADAGDIPDGGLVVVQAPSGHAVLRARHDPGLRPGTLFAPMHWTDRFCPAGRINPAVNAATDPVSGQPELKHTPVRIRPFPARWHGFVLARRALGTGLAAWCAIRPPVGGVWRHELAGEDGPVAAGLRLRTLCTDIPGWMTLDDPARGVFRAVLLRFGHLQACVFLRPDHRLPARDWLQEAFAHDVMPAEIRHALLAGAPAGGQSADPPICVCHGIGAQAIGDAIVAGFADVAAVGRATRAGTNCGSCRPEIAALLAARVTVAA